MDILNIIWDFFWSARTNDLITQWLAGNAVLLAIAWQLYIKVKKYKASLTPGKGDDEAAAKLEQIGNDMFRIILPKGGKKTEKSEGE